MSPARRPPRRPALAARLRAAVGLGPGAGRDPLEARWAALLGPTLAAWLADDLPRLRAEALGALAPADARAVEDDLLAWLGAELPRGLLGGRREAPPPAPAGAEVALVAARDGRLHVPEADVQGRPCGASTLDPDLAPALAASLEAFALARHGRAVLGAPDLDLAQAARRAPALLALGRAVVALLGRLEAARVLVARRPRLVLRAAWVLDAGLLPAAARGPARPGVPAGGCRAIVDTATLPPAAADAALAALGDLDAARTGLLVLGDAAHGLGLLRPGLAGRVQLAYQDPPFNTASAGFDYRDRYGAAEWLCLVEDRLRLLVPLLRADAAVFTHIDQREKERLRLLLDRHLVLVSEVIWRIGWVSGFKSRAARFVRNHETIYHHGRTARPLFVKRWLPYPPGYRRRGDGAPPRGPGYPLEDTWNCGPLDRLDSIQLKSFSREKVGRRALTQKNEDLLERVVLSSSRPGDLVLDPYLGSGTTAAAAHKLGRRWVGLELGAVQAAHARPRLARVVAGDAVGISKAAGWTGGGAFEAWTLEDHAAGLWTALAPGERPGRGQLALRLAWADDGAPRLTLAAPRLDDPRRAWLRAPGGGRARLPLDLPASLAALLGLRVRRRVPAPGALVVWGDDPAGAQVVVAWARRAPGATDADHAATLAAALAAVAAPRGPGVTLLASGLDDARALAAVVGGAGSVARAEDALARALGRAPPSGRAPDEPGP